VCHICSSNRGEIGAHDEDQDQARREAEEQELREAEEQIRWEAEEYARREQARREAEEQVQREAEEQARREAEEQARREAEEQAQREAEEQARRKAEEQARREAEEQARREAEEQARQEAEEQARREAAEQARREAEEQARREEQERKDHEGGHSRSGGSSMGSSSDSSVETSPFSSPVPERAFGVEFEMFLPNSKSWNLHDLQRNLKDAGINCKVEKYSNKEVVAHWKIAPDSSIRPNLSGDLTFELISPVLQGTEGLAQCRRLLSAASLLGVEVNETAGFHVHINARDLCSAQIANVAQFFLKYEEGIDLMVPASRRGHSNAHIRSNQAMFWDKGGKQTSESIVQAAGSMQDLMLLVNPGTPLLSGPNPPCTDERKYKLNLRAYDKHQTIEFRQHSGTYDCTKAEAWIRFLLRFVTFSARQVLLSKGVADCSRSSDGCAHGPVPVHYFEDNPPLQAHQKFAQMFDRLIDDAELMDFYLDRVDQLQERVGHKTKSWKCSCGKAFDHVQHLSRHQLATDHCDENCPGRNKGNTGCRVCSVARAVD
jgi:hypothetical protein